jgi:hypothetical protein
MAPPSSARPIFRAALIGLPSSSQYAVDNAAGFPFSQIVTGDLEIAPLVNCVRRTFRSATSSSRASGYRDRGVGVRWRADLLPWMPKIRTMPLADPGMRGMG